MIEKGLEYSVSTRVDESNTARKLGSGDMDVLATPAMIALMENAAMMAVAAFLPEGSSTVGTHLDVNHSRATAPGDIVTGFARLAEVDGRRLVFDVRAVDSKGEIGSGRHERFIVERQRFLGKL